MKTRIIAGISIVVATIVALGVFGAVVVSAQVPTPAPGTATPPAAGQPVRLAGKVSSVATGSLVLNTRGGDITVNVGANTFIVIKQNGTPAQGTLADLTTDKATVVVGVATSDPIVVDARMITQGALTNGAVARFLANHPKVRAAIEHIAAGTITAINGNTITLQGVKVPSVTVQTSDNTVVLNNGFTAVSSLKVGDKVTVLGASAGPAANTPPGRGARAQVPQSRTINAWGLHVDNGTTQVSAARVDTVNGDTLSVKTLKNRDGATIQLDGNTEYRSLTVSVANRNASLAQASQSDIRAGSNLIVEGVASSDGKTITAKAVIILPGGKAR